MYFLLLITSYVLYVHTAERVKKNLRKVNTSVLACRRVEHVRVLLYHPKGKHCVCTIHSLLIGGTSIIEGRTRS